TARCFNKSKGVLITGLKLKAFRNPQPSWGFSIDKKISQHPLAYGKLYLRKAINRYFWQLNVPAAQS
ncbi:hypothetical protein, partial [Salmonella enterica]